VAGAVLLREGKEILDKLALALGLIGISRHRFTSRYSNFALHNGQSENHMVPSSRRVHDSLKLWRANITR
jgi:hypothetical protein